MDRRYEAALQAALADLTADPEVVGILFTGSVQQGRPEHTSDLDLYVITHKPYYWRATRLYEGVETELFFNNVASMRWRITRPNEIAAMAGFATGEILLDRTGETAELQAVARARWEAGSPAPTEDEITMYRYGLHDRYDDLQDVAHDPVASKVAAGALVQLAMEAYCKLNRHWGTKPKRLVAYVKERDPLLGVMLDDYYARGMHPKHAFEIVDYVLAPFGGRLQVWESKQVNYPGGTDQ